MGTGQHVHSYHHWHKWLSQPGADVSDSNKLRPPPPPPSKVVTRPGYGLLEVTTDRRHTADGSNLEIWGVAAYMCALLKIRLAIQQAVVSVLCFTQYYQQLDPIHWLNFPGKAYLQHCDFSSYVSGCFFFFFFYLKSFHTSDHRLISRLLCFIKTKTKTHLICSYQPTKIHLCLLSIQKISFTICISYSQGPHN